MKAKYKIIYKFNEALHEFEAEIERKYKCSDAELVKALYPKFVEHLAMLAGDGKIGHGVFCVHQFEFIGPA